MEFDVDLITEIARKTIQFVQNGALQRARVDPGRSFNPMRSQRSDGTWKDHLGVDWQAELEAAEFLHHHLRKLDPLVLGEESSDAPAQLTKDLDLTDTRFRDRLVVLLDMIDGTDLFERGLSNWCSAMIFYHPATTPEDRIIAAFVGLPKEAIYYARRDQKGVFKYSIPQRQKPDDATSVPGPSTIKDVESASVAFYGQKSNHLLSVAVKEKLTEQQGRKRSRMVLHPFARNLWAQHRRNQKRNHKPRFRIYNLAGNPIMMRMIDGPKKIDAVFELLGQYPHDAVPGLYIAQKAGAIVRSPEGNEIGPVDLSEALLRPASDEHKIRYVLASTHELAAEIIECISARQP